jgi:hypothetical protein
MRRVLIVVLSLGVFFGYGSAVARASWYARNGGGGCHGWQSRYDDRYGHGYGRYDRFRNEAPAPAAAAAPVAPQTVVVQPPAAPAPVYIVIPQGAAPAAPQTIVVQPQQLPAPAPAPAAAVPSSVSTAAAQ